MNDQTALARATSAAFPALMQFCEQYGMLCLFLNQARTKIGVMFGDPTSTPGGQAPEFYASVRIKLGRRQIAVGKGADKEVVGQEIGAECVKNKVNRPFGKTRWNFMFQPDGTGRFDVLGSIYTLLVEEGKLERRGAYVVWEGDNRRSADLLAEIRKDEAMQNKMMALLTGDAA